jgi:hypothetical protein
MIQDRRNACRFMITLHWIAAHGRAGLLDKPAVELRTRKATSRNGLGGKLNAHLVALDNYRLYSGWITRLRRLWNSEETKTPRESTRVFTELSLDSKANAVRMLDALVGGRVG